MKNNLLNGSNLKPDEEGIETFCHNAPRYVQKLNEGSNLRPDEEGIETSYIDDKMTEDANTISGNVVDVLNSEIYPQRNGALDMGRRSFLPCKSRGNDRKLKRRERAKGAVISFTGERTSYKIASRFYVARRRLRHSSHGYDG